MFPQRNGCQPCSTKNNMNNMDDDIRKYNTREQNGNVIGMID